MLEELIAYMESHLISLEQDADKLTELMNAYHNHEDDDYRDLDVEDISNGGQIIATAHLLSVARDILLKTNEG